METLKSYQGIEASVCSSTVYGYVLFLSYGPVHASPICHASPSAQSWDVGGRHYLDITSRTVDASVTALVVAMIVVVLPCERIDHAQAIPARGKKGNYTSHIPPWAVYLISGPGTGGLQGSDCRGA